MVYNTHGNTCGVNFWRHFNDLVFNSIIQRNVKLSEAASYGQPVLLYDAKSTGALNYLDLAKECIEREHK